MKAADRVLLAAFLLSATGVIAMCLNSMGVLVK